MNGNEARRLCDQALLCEAGMSAVNAHLPVKFSAMRQAIAAAYEVDELKQIRDQALLLETAMRMAKDIETSAELVRYAFALKDALVSFLRAWRRRRVRAEIQAVEEPRLCPLTIRGHKRSNN
jgi:hypothetical protein